MFEYKLNAQYSVVIPHKWGDVIDFIPPLVYPCSIWSAIPRRHYLALQKVLRHTPTNPSPHPLPFPSLMLSSNCYATVICAMSYVAETDCSLPPPVPKTPHLPFPLSFHSLFFVLRSWLPYPPQICAHRGMLRQCPRYPPAAASASRSPPRL